MAFKFNPITGQLDLVGGGSGATDASAVTYTPSVFGDWSPVPGFVDDALDQLAAGGGGGGSDENFSYTNIIAATVTTVKENQQMLYKGDLTVDGDLYVYGEIAQVIDDCYQCMTPSYIPPTESFRIPINRVAFFRDITIDGFIRVEGDLIGV